MGVVTFEANITGLRSKYAPPGEAGAAFRNSLSQLPMFEFQCCEYQSVTGEMATAAANRSVSVGSHADMNPP